MPITIEHDPERRLIRVVLRGRCSRDQIGASIELLASDPALLVPANVLWDLGDAQVDVSSAEVRELVDAFALRQASFPGDRVAILAPSDASFGLGRMGQSYWEFATRRETLKVFRAAEEADAWLDMDARPAAP